MKGSFVEGVDQNFYSPIFHGATTLFAKLPFLLFTGIPGNLHLEEKGDKA